MDTADLNKDTCSLVDKRAFERRKWQGIMQRSLPWVRAFNQPTFDKLVPISPERRKLYLGYFNRLLEEARVLCSCWLELFTWWCGCLWRRLLHCVSLISFCRWLSYRTATPRLSTRRTNEVNYRTSGNWSTSRWFLSSRWSVWIDGESEEMVLLLGNNSRGEY